LYNRITPHDVLNVVPGNGRKKGPKHVVQIEM